MYSAGEELARFNIQADLVHRDEITEAARDIPDFELGHSGLPIIACTDITLIDIALQGCTWQKKHRPIGQG